MHALIAFLSTWRLEIGVFKACSTLAIRDLSIILSPSLMREDDKCAHDSGQGAIAGRNK